jgi:hypothetical protein
VLPAVKNQCIIETVKYPGGGVSFDNDQKKSEAVFLSAVAFLYYFSALFDINSACI